jgi:hypothetical protein
MLRKVQEEVEVSSRQRLKPTCLTSLSYGLKPVPFKHKSFSA